MEKFNGICTLNILDMLVKLKSINECAKVEYQQKNKFRT